MNSFEIASITFVVGLILGAIVEYKYGAKISADVSSDVAKLKADVASLQTKAAAVVAAAK